MKRDKYDKRLKSLDLELVAMARWVKATGQRIIILFEGRDTAGKGGAIDAIHAHINPRDCRIVALGKPDKVLDVPEYFDRYTANLPGPGQIALFDRSWYNRAGVERVMGFCTEQQAEDFLAAVPAFEKSLVDQGIILLKYWLCCDQKEQEERFAERLADPLKQWKLSPIDLAARQHYDDYTAAREAMLKATHSKWALWTLVDFNDQRRGRLTLIRDLLDRLPETKTPLDLPLFGKLDAPLAKETYAVVEPISAWPPKKD
ncbi:MAG: polyphosphate kinase 2 [Sphingomicrobium sp.]|nr:polyphosphate kinase 2 [Sphingomonadales bacterium]